MGRITARLVPWTLLALLATAYSVPGASAAATCEITASLSPAERMAEITERQPARVVFVGNATVTKLPGVTGGIQIVASMSTGWAVTVSPASVTAGAAQTYQWTFNVTVVVPAGELATNIGQVSVNLTGQIGSEACTPTQLQAIVSPRAYWGVPDVDIQAGFIEVRAPDETAAFDVLAFRPTNVNQSSRIWLALDGPPGLIHNVPAEVVAANFSNGSIWARFLVTLDTRAVAIGDHTVRIVASAENTSYQDIEEGDLVFVRVLPKPFSVLLALSVAFGAMASVSAVTLWWRRKGRGRAP